MKWMNNCLSAILFIVFLFLAACGGGGGGSSEGETPETVTTSKISGVIAEGFAVSEASVSIIDAIGQTYSGGSTDVSGNYSFDIPESAKFPLLVYVSRSDNSDLFTIVAAKHDTNSTTIAHINPVTSFLAQNLAGSEIPDQFSTPLLTITYSQHNSSGQDMVDKLLGGGSSFSSFNDDPDFVARTVTGEASTPSSADVILDTLGDLAEDAATGINAILSEKFDSEGTTAFLEEDEFQVNLSENLINVGYTATEAIEMLQQDISEESIIDTVESITTILESAKEAAISEGVDSEDISSVLEGITSAIKETLKEEKESNSTTQVSGTALENLTRNVVTIVQSDIIQVVQDNSNALTQEELVSVTKSSGQQTGPIIGQINATESLSDTEIAVIEEDITNVISFTAETLVTAIQTTGDLEEALQQSETEIQASTTAAATQVAQKLSTQTATVTSTTTTTSTSTTTTTSTSTTTTTSTSTTTTTSTSTTNNDPNPTTATTTSTTTTTLCTNPTTSTQFSLESNQFLIDDQVLAFDSCGSGTSIPTVTSTTPYIAMTVNGVGSDLQTGAIRFTLTCSGSDCQAKDVTATMYDMIFNPTNGYVKYPSTPKIDYGIEVANGATYSKTNLESRDILITNGNQIGVSTENLQFFALNDASAVFFLELTSPLLTNGTYTITFTFGDDISFSPVSTYTGSFIISN